MNSRASRYSPRALAEIHRELARMDGELALWGHELARIPVELAQSQPRSPTVHE